MKIYISIIICFIVFSDDIIAQVELFSKTFSHGLRIVQTELLHEDENYYYSMGYAEDSIGSELGLHVAVHDKTNWDVVKFSYFELDSIWMFIGNSIRVIDINDTLYFCANAGNKNYLMAYAKATGSLIIKRSMTNPLGGGTYTHDLRREKHRFLISYTANDDVKIVSPAIWIANDDGTDEIRYVDNSEKLIAAGKFVRMDNGNYLFLTTELFNGEYRYKLNISELDSNFNLLWIWSTPESDKAWVNSEVLPINDDEYMILYRAEKPTVIYQNRAWPHSVMRFNIKTKKVVWKKDVASPVSLLESHIGGMVKSNIDSESFLVVTNVVGENSTIDSFITKGRVLKINIDGKIVWQRDYAIFSNAPITTNLFHNIISTYDGNYLIGGTAFNNQIMSWLVKVNENGHIVGDTTSQIDWVEANWKDKITIYPVPANDILYINQDDISEVEYELYDLSGKLVNQLAIDSENQSTGWDISHLPDGNYIMLIKRNGKKIGTLKIILSGGR